MKKRSSSDGVCDTDEYGNPIIWLNRYEAERVSECLKKLRANNVQGYDTGDWFLDVPRKIDQWSASLSTGLGADGVSPSPTNSSKVSITDKGDNDE